MARVATVSLVDDLDGGEAAETVTFGLDGRQHAIDLSESNAAKLRDLLAPYIAAARKTGGPGRGNPTSRRSPTDRAGNRDLREWARAAGIEIGDRGRIPNDIQEAYQAGNASLVSHRFRRPALAG
ncbi:Lsr2 protein [Pseudonocardia sediminis]|uniref:Lsr2 protein n=1 Tax=Pseudonocardia sediminis TaxID=1397368 RepID=A0A4Q7V1Z1_PSEST|nr:Lsr2 family protein [Pseudonocardia sediminis]RZT87494.1 Lsr2 protein [Pseudonocardia sediminis]